ncbi:Uncharacterised protein [Vibrio cholerae]|nr:Uncharacterised protein [Vibrio cholerae]
MSSAFKLVAVSLGGQMRPHSSIKRNASFLAQCQKRAIVKRPSGWSVSINSILMSETSIFKYLAMRSRFKPRTFVMM